MEFAEVGGIVLRNYHLLLQIKKGTLKPRAHPINIRGVGMKSAIYVVCKSRLKII